MFQFASPRLPFPELPFPLFALPLFPFPELPFPLLPQPVFPWPLLLLRQRSAGSATTVADPAPKAVGIAIAGNTPIRPTSASGQSLGRVLPNSRRLVITSPH